MLTDRVRLIKHEVIPGTGSFEVRVEGQPSAISISKMWPAAGCRPEQLTSKQALEQAKAFARAQRDRP